MARGREDRVSAAPSPGDRARLVDLDDGLQERALEPGGSRGRTDFAARAEAVCEKALEAKQGWSAFPVSNFDPAHPDPSAFPKVTVWLEDQVAPTLTAWLSGLKDLGEPPAGRQAWSDVLADVTKIVQFNADQIAAAKAGDVARFAAATSGGRATNVELERAAAAAGVPTCADVHS